jgi:hypothetical protein
VVKYLLGSKAAKRAVGLAVFEAAQGIRGDEENLHSNVQREMCPVLVVWETYDFAASIGNNGEHLLRRGIERWREDIYMRANDLPGRACDRAHGDGEERMVVVGRVEDGRSSFQK